MAKQSIFISRAYRSVPSDANKQPSHEVFEEIYYGLLEHFTGVLSDIRSQYCWDGKIRPE